MTNKIIRIRNSNLASIAGLNKYNSEQERLELLLDINSWLKPYLKKRRSIKKTYNSETKKKLDSLSESELITIALCLGLDTNQSISSLNDCCYSVFQDYINQCVQCKSGLESKCNLEKLLNDKKTVYDIFFNCLEIDIQKKHGLHQENNQLNQFERENNIQIVDRNDMLYNKTLDVVNGVEIQLIGQVDGISGDGTNIVENKYRRNNFFTIIPIYEKVQLEGYLWLTGLEKAVHIQNYEGEQRITSYTSNGQLWSQIVDNVHKFIDNHFDLSRIKK